MEILVIISSLFVIGCVAGWIIELLFRRFVSRKKWMNPGFLIGPYLPLYGFGVLLLYGIMNINIPIQNEAWCIVIKILIIGFGMTFIELIAGLIFIKGMKLKLWDYSDRWGNYKGIICPLFSFLWLIAGAIYAFFINPYLVQAIAWISKNLVYSYFIGLVIGMMVVDCAYSFHIGLKIRKANEDVAIRFDEFKLYLHEKYKTEDNKKPFSGYVISNLNHRGKIRDSIKEYKLNTPSKKKWWKKEIKTNQEQKQDGSNEN